MVIKPANIKCSVAIVFPSKKNCSPRFCADYRTRTRWQFPIHAASPAWMFVSTVWERWRCYKHWTIIQGTGRSKSSSTVETRYLLSRNTGCKIYKNIIGAEWCSALLSETTGCHTCLCALAVFLGIIRWFSRIFIVARDHFKKMKRIL